MMMGIMSSLLPSDLATVFNMKTNTNAAPTVIPAQNAASKL
jgi:hypothetical protein